VKEKTITPKTGFEQPESAWRAGEALKQDYARDIEFLSRSALAFFELPPEGDVYQLIIKLLSDMLKNDAILAIGDYDEKSDTFQPRAIHGIENAFGALKKILGKDPFELSGDFGPIAKMALATGKLTKVDRGLRDFSDKLLTKPVAQAVEKLLGLTGFYVVGFTKAGKIQGGLSIVTRKQTALPDPALIEAFAFQAAVELEKRRAEEALRFTRFSVDNAVDTMVCVDHDAHFIDVNNAFCRISGYSREELLSMTVHDIDPDYSAEVWLEFWEKLKQSGSLTFESGHRTKEGKIFPVEITASYFEYNGKEYHVSFARDITDRKLAEEALRESEERFRRIFEEGPLGMVTADMNFHFIRANAAFCRMVGYAEHELTSLTFQDITHPDHLAGDTESLMKLFHGEIPLYRTKKRYVRKDKEIVWGALTVSSIRDKSGQFLYFLSMIEDITERKRAEEALVQSEANYSELANSLPTCIFDTDLSGKLTFANQTAFEWFGYSQAELLAGTNVLQMLVEADRQRGGESFRKVLSAGEASTGEYLALRKDGRSFPALVTSRAILKDG